MNGAHLASLSDLYRESQALALAWRRAEAAQAGRSADALVRARTSAESLRVTSRLMAIVCNLLQRRAIAAGELAPDTLRPLDTGATLAAAIPDQFPAPLRPLAAASRDLYTRVAALPPP